MSSIREQIIVAVVAALNVGSPPAVTERTRLSAIEDSGLPSIVVFPLDDTAEEIGGGGGPIVRSRLKLGFELRAKGTAIARADTAVDALYVWLIKKVAGNQLGGLAIDIVEGDTSFRFESGENPMCLATVDMTVVYQHLTANPEARV